MNNTETDIGYVPQGTGIYCETYCAFFNVCPPNPFISM